MQQTFPIHGIDCISCATIVKNKSLKLQGITACYVDVENKTVQYDYDETIIEPETIAKEMQKYGYDLVISNQGTAQNQESENNESKNSIEYRNLLIAIPLCTIALLDMFWMIGGDYGRRAPMSETLNEFFHHLLPIFATIMLFVVGPKYISAVGRYFQHGTASMDTLVGLGSITAYVYSFIVTAFEKPLAPYIDVSKNYYEAVIVVIGFIALGKYLEHRTMAKSGAAIKALLGLQAKKANRIEADGTTTEVDIQALLQGDIIQIKPGEKVPLDAEIITGTSDIDEAMITGESLPVSKGPGQQLIGGTINLNGSLTARITAVSSQSYLSKIISSVAIAQQSRPAIQALVDKIMVWFIPLVFGIAILAALVWIFVGKNVSIAIASFIGVLVIACPCGIGLATPMAVTTGVGHLAKNGILCKNAEGLLKLRKASTFIFDKTGTLTEGKPKLQHETIFGNKEEIGSILYALESQASHPLATAICEHYLGYQNKNLVVDDFVTIPGGGLSGTIGGHNYIIANPAYLENNNINYDKQIIQTITTQAMTPVFLLQGNTILAILGLADQIKSSSLTTVKELQKQGKEVIIISGDHEDVVKYVAAQMGITRYYAQIKPTEKADLVKKIAGKQEVVNCGDGCCPPVTKKDDNYVVMVGDGINDAPALAQADIGIAMSTGTDIAIESADLTLLHGDISKILKAITISKLTHSAIMQNLCWAFSYNIIGIPLAAGVFYPVFGRLLNPAFEGAAMAMSDLTVIGNSIRLQNKKI